VRLFKEEIFLYELFVICLVSDFLTFIFSVQMLM